MKDYTVIQGQTMLVFLVAFLVIIVSSYLWTSWLIRAEQIEAAERKPVLKPLARLRQIKRDLKLSFHRLSFRRRLARSCCLSGEWLAPLIAWLAVMLISMAIVGLLLGEE